MSTYNSLYNNNSVNADNISTGYLEVSVSIDTPRLALTATTNQLSLNNTTINDQSSATRVITIPNTVATSADFVLTDSSSQIIGGDNTFTGINSFSAGIKTDDISEYTTNHGVQVETVLIKDNKVCDVVDPTYYNQEFDSANNRIRFNVGGGSVDIAYYSKATVVSDDVWADRILEKTAAAGVTIDGVLLKDGLIADTAYTEGVLKSSSSGVITAGEISNSNVASGAAISYSKLNLLSSVKASDINAETSTNGWVLKSNGAGSASWGAVTSTVDLQQAFDNSSPYVARIVTSSGLSSFSIQKGSSGSDASTVLLSILGSSGNFEVYASGQIASTHWASGGGVLKAANLYGTVTAATIVNADIDAAAAISDTKLATISTAGKVSNSATTATSSNTASAIVARDGSGNFTAGTITASISGNASTATSATDSTNAANIAVTDTASASWFWVPFCSGSTGNQALKVNSAGMRYYPSIDALECDLAGTASSASTIAITNDNSSASTHYPMLTTATSSFAGPRVDTGLSYVPSTNTLTTSTFVGALSGNATTATDSTNATNLTGSGTISSTSTCTTQANGTNNTTVASTAFVQNMMPIGSIIMWSLTTAPNSNWLICDGAAVSRTTYSALFAVVGTTFGAGNGTTTFNVPDTREKVVYGYKATTNNVGSTGGNTTVQLTTNELPAHTHGPGTLAQTLSVNHAWLTRTANGSITARTGPTTALYDSNNASLTAMTGVSASTGSGNAFSILPPFLSFNYIIKVL